MANVLLGIHCVVPGCGSTLRRVNQWKAKPCSKPKHKGKTHAQCMCPEPYQFFKFPNEVKLQKLWLERVKRPDLEVNNLTRVCSMHFVEGRPTRRHYFPNVNLHQEEEEADNEEETEDHYYDEGEEDPHLDIREAIATPPKKGRSGTVSIVPMELLQEHGDEDGVEEQVEDDEYEGDLTISRYKNFHGSEEGGYEIPSNSVTITRVTSVPAAAAACTKPSNRFINTKKTRVEGASAGNRFLKDRVTTGTGKPGNSSVSLVRSSSRPQATVTSSHSRPPPAITNSKSNNASLRVGGRLKVQQTRQEEDNRPYDIDMVVDDDDGDSSELSDIGIDIQSPSSLSKQYTSKDISTAKTLSSLVVSRQHVTFPPQPQKEINVKPKLIPVLAVAPKSQLQLQQQGKILQPVQAITRNINLINKKPNLIAATTPAKAATAISSAAGSAPSSTPAKTIVAVSGSSSVKTETTSVATANSVPTPSSSNSNETSQQKPAAPTPSTLATYDPSKQQLQIANPVKYIQECHTRISQLLADKQKLESQNNDLEAKVQELQKSNNDLRREIVHQALNAARRTPQQLNTPTFNLVPTAIMDTASSSAESQNGNGSSDSTSGGGGGGGSNKPTVRYVIRRPSNLKGETNSTK